jgi:hypothetical protein
MPDDVSYSAWRLAEGRFAIAAGQNVLPILGYVFQNSDGTWSLERRGQILEVSYGSLAEAAQALLELESG